MYGLDDEASRHGRLLDANEARGSRGRRARRLVKAGPTGMAEATTMLYTMKNRVKRLFFYLENNFIY